MDQSSDCKILKPTVSLNEPTSLKTYDEIEVKPKNNNYYGVFAKKDLPEGTLLLTISTDKTQPQADRFSVQFNLGQHLDSDYIQWLKFTNHKCDPNIRFSVNLESVQVFAAKNLSLGEELTFNYLTTEYDMHEKFDCNCDSKICYKVIGGFKHLSSEAKLDLYPKLTPYLRTMYEEELKK